MTDFQIVLNDICYRPEMYVVEVRFWTVAAWLDGYYSGLSKCEGFAFKNADLNMFRDWLSLKFSEFHEIEPNLIWQAYISRIYPNDNQAIQQLAILFNEFVKEKGLLNSGLGLP